MCQGNTLHHPGSASDPAINLDPNTLGLHDKKNYSDFTTSHLLFATLYIKDSLTMASLATFPNHNSLVLLYKLEKRGVMVCQNKPDGC